MFVHQAIHRHLCHSLDRVNVKALVFPVNTRHVFKNGCRVFHDKSDHKDDGENIEEPRSDDPCKSVVSILLGKELKELARHEEHEPDAEFQHES